MQCPSCNQPMSQTEQAGIPFTYCAGCKGAWIAAREMELLLSAAARRPSPAVEPPYDPYPRARHDDHYPDYHHNSPRVKHGSDDSDDEYGLRGHGRERHGQGHRRGLLRNLFNMFD